MVGALLMWFVVGITVLSHSAGLRVGITWRPDLCHVSDTHCIAWGGGARRACNACTGHPKRSPELSFSPLTPHPASPLDQFGVTANFGAIAHTGHVVIVLDIKDPIGLHYSHMESHTLSHMQRHSTSPTKPHIAPTFRHKRL